MKYNGWSRSYVDEHGRLVYENANKKTEQLSTADLDMIDYHGLTLPPIDKKSENDIDMGNQPDAHDKEGTESKE
jgi:hypothetical protein